MNRTMQISRDLGFLVRLLMKRCSAVWMNTKVAKLLGKRETEIAQEFSSPTIGLMSLVLTPIECGATILTGSTTPRVKRSQTRSIWGLPEVQIASTSHHGSQRTRSAQRPDNTP